MADTEDAIQMLEQSGYNISHEALTALRDAFSDETKALKLLSKTAFLTLAM